MKRFSTLLVLWGLLLFPLVGNGQGGGIEPLLDAYQDEPQTAMLDVSPTQSEPKEAARVTAVYGVGVDDYLPLKQVARKHLRPNVRKHVSRPAFYLPDAFFFIGAPVFILIFLRVLVIFLNGFEEKRQEELRMIASEYLPGERLSGD
jgi:hypothetical protein